jgi:hypothetical protein
VIVTQETPLLLKAGMRFELLQLLQYEVELNWNELTAVQVLMHCC